MSIDNDLLKQILLFKVKSGIEKEKSVLKIQRVYVNKIINKAKRNFFSKVKQKNLIINNEIFFEENDFKSESFICLCICLEKFDITKQVMNPNAFYGYFSISIKRYFERIFNKLFSLEQLPIDKIKESKSYSTEHRFEMKELMSLVGFNLIEKRYVESRLQGMSMFDFCKKFSINKNFYNELKREVEKKLLKNKPNVRNID